MFFILIYGIILIINFVLIGKYVHRTWVKFLFGLLSFIPGTQQITLVILITLKIARS